ncbi:MAG TPA: CarD family transcriptional regulator [Anaerolineae bacterium]
MTERQAFSPKDWIVHRHYGVGQVLGTETKTISGEENDYYKIKTRNSTIWVAVDQLDEGHFRPLATPQEFREVLAVLERPPRKMKQHFNSRKRRINQVEAKNSPLALARMIRDLSGRQKRRGSLSNTEHSALRRFTKRLLAEWSICMNVDVKEAQKRLHGLLQKDKNQSAKVNQA